MTPVPSVAPEPTRRTPLSGFGAIADRYDLLLCDVFGVLHDAHTAFSEASEALIRFRARGGAVVLVSNSAAPGTIVAQSLEAKGISPQSWDRVVSSADGARALLNERGIRAAYHLGPERDRLLFEGLALDLVEVAQAEIVVCTGFPEAEVPDAALAVARARGLDLVCTNPDRMLVVDGAVLRFAGLIADNYAAHGGTVLATGKPDVSIYARALRSAVEVRGHALEPGRVVAIGDSPDLDVAGALSRGFAAVWITSHNEPRPRASSSMRVAAVVPWMPALRW